MLLDGHRTAGYRRHQVEGWREPEGRLLVLTEISMCSAFESWECLQTSVAFSEDGAFALAKAHYASSGDDIASSIVERVLTLVSVVSQEFGIKSNHWNQVEL